MLVTCATARSSRCGMIRILLKSRVRVSQFQATSSVSLEEGCLKSRAAVHTQRCCSRNGAAIVCALQSVIGQRLETCLFGCNPVVQECGNLRFQGGHVSCVTTRGNIQPERARHLPSWKRLPIPGESTSRLSDEFRLG